MFCFARYEDKLSTFQSGVCLDTTFPGLQAWEKDQLLAWHLQDPVSPTEINRNNASYTVQGNRNPFIDHPEYVVQIWGTPVVDTEAPTVPTNLIANSPTSNSIAVSWTATDNVGVTSYLVYANGTLKATVSGTTTSTVVTGLSPLTSYTFYVIAKDAAETLLHKVQLLQKLLLTDLQEAEAVVLKTSAHAGWFSQASSYATRTWTNNSITWTATLQELMKQLMVKQFVLKKVLNKFCDCRRSSVFNINNAT
jgi:chitodextrinase